VLDLTVAGIAIVLIAVSVETRHKIDPGLIGLALINIVSFSTNLKFLITNWTLLETSIGAVYRVRDFELGTESETSPTDTDKNEGSPPMLWPEKGTIEFKNASATFK